MAKSSRALQLLALTCAMVPQVFADWTATFYDASDCGASNSAWVTYSGSEIGPENAPCKKIGEPGDNCQYWDKHTGTAIQGDCKWGFDPVNGMVLGSTTMCEIYTDSACTQLAGNNQPSPLMGIDSEYCYPYSPPKYSYAACWDDKYDIGVQ